MTPALRLKLALTAIASVLGVAFAWNASLGQFRPPIVRPPVINPPVFNPPNMRPPGFNPPGINPGGTEIINVWTCTGCGKELGRGLSAPPDKCPSCGARIINGVGNGIPQPGMTNPGGMMPPIVNPPAFVPPVVNDNPSTSSSTTTGETSSTASKKGVIVALVIGIVVVGVLILVGGTFLVIYTMRNSESSKPRPRRRPRDDYDD